MEPIGIDKGMALSGDDFHVFHTNSPEFVGHVFSRFLDIGFMLGRRADAGDAKQIFEFIQESLLIRTGVIHCRGSHSVCLSFGFDVFRV